MHQPRSSASVCRHHFWVLQPLPTRVASREDRRPGCERTLVPLGEGQLVEFTLGRTHSDIAMETGSAGGAELSILSEKRPPKHLFVP